MPYYTFGCALYVPNTLPDSKLVDRLDKIIGREKKLIGMIRRQCLNHVVIFGEDHLRRTLKAYAAYYNHVRTHLALAKDAPLLRPVQQLGDIAVRPILGGLHHKYCRM